MKNFEAKYPLKHYKSYKTWFYQVYRNNKELIDAKYDFNPEVGPYKLFKRAAYELIEQGKSPESAVQTIARSSLFTSKKERYQDYFLESLKSERSAFKRFQELSKDRGRYTRFDSDKLWWSYEDKVYVYDNKVLVSFENSPYQIVVKKISSEYAERLRDLNYERLSRMNAAKERKKYKRKGKFMRRR